MSRKYLAIPVAAAVTAVLASPALAIGPTGMARPSLSPPLIEVQKGTLAPLAYVKYCVSNAGDCAKGDGPSRIDVDSRLLRELRRVNTQVNRAIEPSSDIPGEDSWEADVSSGDCEDYVLTKRKRLIELGWSASALRIAVTYTPTNSGHAVLVVSTSRGDLVLDNRHNSVLDWRDTDLRWQKIQSPDNPLSWNEI
jgi:predicted transglutaminase-like cysteine proteinase